MVKKKGSDRHARYGGSLSRESLGLPPLGTPRHLQAPVGQEAERGEASVAPIVPERVKPVREERLIRGISAPLLAGMEDAHRAGSALAEICPAARRLPVIRAIILGQREVAIAQQVANRRGHPFAEAAEKAITRISTNYGREGGSIFTFRSPIIVPDLTDPDSSTFMIAYQISSKRDINDAKRARTLLRNTVFSSAPAVEMAAAMDTFQNGVVLPIATINNPSSAEAYLHELSGPYLGLESLKLGPFEVHHEIGAPFNLPAPPPQPTA
jgi:hypothetical protein